MKIEISDEVIKRTTKCHSNFSCLNDKENPKCSDRLPMCPVEIKIGSDMVFVYFNYDISCVYNTPFGDNQRICHCPVRYEIYECYKM